MTHHDTRYVIMLRRTPDAGERSEELIRAHVDHLKILEDQGKLVLAGPLIGRNSGMVILNVGSAAEAEEIGNRDPFVVSGDSTCEVWQWLLSCKENDHLGFG